MYRDTVGVSEVIAGQKKITVAKRATLSLYGDRMEMKSDADSVFRFDEINAVTVLGKNKVNVYVNKKIYQFKGDKRFNALKYVNTFYHYKNVQKGDQDGEFLGL